MSFREDLDALKIALQDVLADRISLSSLNLTDANELLNRANQIGEQPIESILGLEASLQNIITQIDNINITGGGDPAAIIDDQANTSTNVWSAEKINLILGDIETALNTILGN